MQAVIMAAGRGTRMKELTENLPKALLPVNGRPIIEHTLNNLPEAISEIILIVGYLGEMIKKHLGKNWCGKPIEYVEQKELNGTAGALWAAKDVLRDKFLVLMGDDLYSQEELATAVKNDLCVLVKESDSPQKFGVVELDADNNLQVIIEKPQNPKTNLVVVGAYVLNNKIFDYEPAPVSDKEFGLPQTIVKMAADWPVKVIKIKHWQAYNSREDLEQI